MQYISIGLEGNRIHKAITVEYFDDGVKQMIQVYKSGDCYEVSARLSNTVKSTMFHPSGIKLPEGLLDFFPSFATALLLERQRAAFIAALEAVHIAESESIEFVHTNPSSVSISIFSSMFRDLWYNPKMNSKIVLE